MLAATSPRFAFQHSGQAVAKHLLRKQGARRSFSNAQDDGVKSPREEAPEFLRREVSLEAVLRLGFQKGAQRGMETADEGMEAPSLERGGFAGGSLSLDFLRRESSLEALRFITSSPGRFGLEAAPSRGVSMEMSKTQSRSAAFEDRTGNPLMSLATAAGMEEHAGSSGNGSASKGLQRVVKVKEELIRDDTKSSQKFNNGKAEILLQACGKASPHSDDSDSDDDPGNLKSRSGFPKPDFEIFQRAPPPPMFPHSHDGDNGEFENILDLGGGDIQVTDSEALNRTQMKKAKLAKATAAFAKAAAQPLKIFVNQSLDCPAFPYL